MFAGALACLPALAQPVQASASQAQALAELPTPVEFLAAVRAHPDVILTQAAYQEALAAVGEALLAHGDGSPQMAQAEEVLDLRRGAWIEALFQSQQQQIDHLRNQGHTAQALLQAYGHLNIYGTS